MSNKNILSKIKKVWARLGEPDIPDETDIPKNIKAEVAKLKKVQEEVHKQGFVPKARVHEERAKVNANKNKEGKQKVLGETKNKIL